MPPSATQKIRVRHRDGDDELVMQAFRGSAISWLSGCGAPMMCGTTISTTPRIEQRRCCAVKAISASPAAVASDRADPPGLPGEKIGGRHGRQFGRQAEAGRQREDGEAGKAQITPWRQLQMPPANSEAATSTGAKPMPLTMLTASVKAKRSKPSAGAQASSPWSCDSAGAARLRQWRHFGGARHGRAPRRARVLEGLGLQDQRDGGVDLQGGKDQAGKQAGEPPRRTRRCEILSWCQAFLSGRESHGMPVVVAGIVHDFHMREADKPTTKGRAARDEAELCSARTEETVPSEEVAVLISNPFTPPPEGIEKNLSPAGLPGQWLCCSLPPSREHPSAFGANCCRAVGAAADLESFLTAFLGSFAGTADRAVITEFATPANPLDGTSRIWTHARHSTDQASSAPDVQKLADAVACVPASAERKPRAGTQGANRMFQ